VRRFLPKSLIGQIALVMAVALLIAQAINFSLIFTERQRVSRAQIEGPAASRFIMTAQRLAADPGEEMTEWRERRRRGRFVLGAESVVPPGASDAALVARLRESASSAGLALRDARAISGGAVEPPERFRDRIPPERRDRIERRLDRLQILIMSIQLEDGRWVNARMITARPNPWLMLRPLAATLLTYAIVLAAMLLIAARIARPLRDLAGAAERFRGNGEAPQVEPRGPGDVRRAILAFNAMSARVGAMLDEKDRMLGAIGHDLRTPLASLRIRAESVEPEEERARMIATIEEMTSMLDDTLALARTGRGVEKLRAIDVAALVDALVEEFRALDQPVEMDSAPRAIAHIQPNLIRRAVRNLIENAIKYAGAARVAVRETGDGIAIDIIDDGPGIPEAELANAAEAFYRIEPSRSRETGGSGLGLTLARAAAQAHGGDLALANRPEGGLCARLLLPCGKA
jgi:signal transduction histidine kinase